MKLKICGLKYPDNIKELSMSAVDYMGFIFYKKSPRYISNMIDFDFIRQLPKHINKTGVFVNEKTYKMFNLIAHYNLDTIQLHGEEPEEVCKELKPYVKIIKAFGIDDTFDFKRVEKYIPYVDFFLFDTLTDSYGGSGKKFNREVLKKYTYDVPFFLSGGIDEYSAGELKHIDHPKLYAIDINSKFEIEKPGLKDVQKIKKFINKLSEYGN